MKALRIKNVRNTVPVILEDEKGGERHYTLKEMMGNERSDYLDSINGNMNYSSTGQFIGIKSYKGMEDGLLLRCLFDEKDKPISPEDIKGMSSQVLNELFLAAQKLNGLDKKAEEESKND